MHFPRFGPLHLNRTRAAHEVLGQHAIETVALEVASTDAVYDWRVEPDTEAYRRETLFPGRSYDDIAPRIMHRGVVDALDRLDPDAILIHSYSMPDARACLWWCRRRQRIAVYSAESTAGDAARSPWREAAKRAIVRHFDAALASGTLAREYAVSLGVPAERIALGYSVVDNDYFAEAAARARAEPSLGRDLPGLDDESPFFFASARFIDRKDLPTLLRGYAAYRNRSDSPWRLVLLGDGAGRSELEGIIASESVSGVTLAGWQQIDTIPLYYARASAFVHTALVDQWGLVVNEAMAAGLPVAVSMGAGCAVDLVEEGANGFTFAPRDVDGLARCMYALAHEVDIEEFGRRSRQIIDRWPLRMFGEGLLAAVRAGAEVADRGLSPAASLLIHGLRLASPHARAFHSVQS